MGKNHQGDFSYTLLDSKTRNIVSQKTLEIKSLMRLTTENIISIGKKLIEVKEQLKHGNFQNWLRSEFEWSEQTARQFMQVYRWSETIENKNFVFSQLATSALYLLAAPSTSFQAREKIIKMVNQGEKITYTCAKSVIESYKKPALSEKNQVNKIIDVEAREEIALSKSQLSVKKLFRLETEDIGCIVRLYEREEIAANTEVKVGATVTINVGSLQGKTAKIVEILSDLQSSDISIASSNISNSKSVRNEIKISTISNISFLEKTAIRQSNRHLIIRCENAGLTVEGNLETLTAFVKQIQNNKDFGDRILLQMKRQSNN